MNSGKWIAELTEFAHGRGRNIWPAPQGIGIDFADGYDACWFLVNEVTSTIPLDCEPENVTTLIQEFLSLEERREQALIIIRHCLVDNKVAVERRKNGYWPTQHESATSQMEVGAHLTYLLRSEQSMADVIKQFCQCNAFIRPPYPQRMEHYLQLIEPPADLPWQTDPTSDFKSTLTWVMGTKGICKLIKSINSKSREINSIEQLKEMSDEATKGGKIVDMLVQMNKLIPNVEASIDFLYGHINLRFDDGNDSYILQHLSRKVVDLIKAYGPHETAQKLVEEYQEINRKRKQVLDAAKCAAQQLGWQWEGGSDYWHFGKGMRQVSLPLCEELTKALQQAIDQAHSIRLLVKDSTTFAEACIRCLETNGEVCGEEMTSTPLPPSVVQQPRLVELTPDIIAKMDTVHRQSLDEHLNDRGISSYLNRLHFQPFVDTWVTEKDWKRCADRELKNDFVSFASILILDDQCDPRAETLVNSRLNDSMMQDDIYDDEVVFAWQYRNSVPALGVEWFQSLHENVPHEQVRQRLGDPIAIRQLLVSEDLDNLSILDWPDSITREIANAWIDQAQRERYRAELLLWAQTHFQWVRYLDEPFRAAWALNLPDVMDALEQNPYLTEALLVHNEKREFCCEPGIYLAEKMLLYWSLLKPTRLLARIIASTDREAFRRQNRGRSSKLQDVGIDYETLLNHWYKSLKVPLAIAWHRCRQAGVAEPETA